MSDETLDVCRCCGAIIEMGERICPNCSEVLDEVDVDQ